MQIVIALPDEERSTVETPICGVPLLTRVISAAIRAGGSSVLLLAPPGWPLRWLSQLLKSQPIESVFVEAEEFAWRFDPEKTEHWQAAADRLEERFVWIPYDYIPHKAPLAELLETAKSHPGSPVSYCLASGSIFERPAVLLRRQVVSGDLTAFGAVPVITGQPGVSARQPAVIKGVEAELVRRSGKVTDGIFSTFNRMLCRPAVRWLTHTPVTPNMVSFAGLGIALLAGLCFAENTWAWNVFGAALFFLSGLFDEIDGMLARLTFRESPFGCWLETMADYASYLLIFAGMAIGGYRRGGWVYLVIGAALLFGCVLSFAVISVQRKLAAPANRPNEYSRLYLEALDRDARNPISRLVRQLQFLTKKGVLIHYLLVFAIVGVLPVVLFLCAVGANIAWMVTIYFNRRLFSSKQRRSVELKSVAPAVAELKQ